MNKNKTAIKAKNKQCDKNPDVSYIKKIVKILKDNNLAEIKYETNEVEIKVVAQTNVQPINSVPASQPSPFGSVSQSVIVPQINPTSPSISIPQAPDVTSSSANKKAIHTDYSKHPGAIKSPMVGTCYLSPEPGAPKFIEVGNFVKKDQPLLIIEAMKVMNYIKAPKDGKIVYIAVEDAQPTEFGQLLLVIE